MKKLCLTVIILLSCSINAICYEVNVHQEISKKAITYSNADQALRRGLQISLSNKFSDGLKVKSASEWIEIGSNWEDDSSKLAVLFVGRVFNHFYDPITGKGLNGVGGRWGQPSLVWGKDYYGNLWNWKWARDFHYNALTSRTPKVRETNFAKTFRSVGQIMHLAHDLAVPAHVRNDPHGPFLNYDMYEEYTKARPNSLVYNGFSAVDISVFNVFDKFWTNGGNGLSEYTNANFFSRDTIFKDYAQPARENTNYEDFGLLPLTVVTTPDGVKHNTYYIRKNDNGRRDENGKILAGLRYFARDIQRSNKYDLLFTLDDRCHKEYAKELVPRAVGYSAGLLNYFFRGDIRLEYVTSPSLGYVIVNNTDEDLSGLFQVFYDDSIDQRTEITNKQLSIAKKGRSSVFDIATPDNAKEPGKYILVFKGSMGNETGAVAGYVYTGGTLEITPPSRYVYAIIDGSEEPQQFTKLKAKIRNKTDKEIGAGTLQAIARYKTRTDYMPDLSSDPPDISSREEGYSYSGSAMVSVSSLSSASSAEILFDFKTQPIPAGITDLELFVNFNGTIGGESGVVTGKKDLSEPTHHLFWNLTDRFSLYGKLYTNLEILEDPELVKFADLDGNGFYDETEKGEPYIDPHPVTLKIAYYEGDPPEGSLQEAAVVEKMPEGRHIRLISLFDREKENKLRLTWVDDIYQVSIPYKYIFTASRNQSEGGEFIVTRPGEFRTLRSHLSQGVLNCEPAGTNPETGNNYCTYPKAQEQPPEIITPYPAMIKFP